jgi:hypothetical protein
MPVALTRQMSCRSSLAVEVIRDLCPVTEGRDMQREKGIINE